MRSEILICKDNQNKLTDCKDIEFPDGSEYIAGTVELWTEWIDSAGKLDIEYVSMTFVL